MGKAMMFFGFVWMITCIAGGIMTGSVTVVSTYLTADLTPSGTTLNVASTTGLRAPGIVVIGNERIAYSSITSTTIAGTLARPLTRGASGTTATAHSSGESVRTLENSLVNASVDYNLAVLSDASGLLAFVTVPLAIFNIIKSFAATPFGFLGTDLQILTFLWGIAFMGFITSFFIQVAGGRKAS